jgi:two-component system sensor histidine kinase VicK
MFKSIQAKIMAMFVLLVLSAELAAAFFGIYKTVRSFHRDFDSAVETVFTDDKKLELTDAANAVSVPHPDEGGDEIIMTETGPDNIENIAEIIMDDADLLSIGKSVSMYIIDENGAVVRSTDGASAAEDSDVIRAALNGSEASNTSLTHKSLEYALPLMSGGTVRYIVYLKDDLEVQHEVTKVLWSNLLLILAVSAVIALIMAFALSKGVTAPIKGLSIKAKKLADGDNNAITFSDRKDEIGELSNSLLYLSATRREHEDKATAEMQKIEKILQNMNDGILAFDMKGKLMHINPEARRLLNRKFVDDITFNRFFKEINADITLESLQYLPSDDSVEREIRINNQVLRFNFAVFSHESSDGGVIVIIHDITKHERLEGARRDFVANVSHELRTPLTVIKSYADILADTPDAEPQVRTRFLDTISSETDRMTKIISDLLTLSKLDENANYTLPSDDIDIRSMLEGLVERLSLSAKKKEQTLAYTPINDVPHIKGDRDGLERVFTNIISNALKYTPSGGEIHVFSSKVYNDILVKISDNGIGIPKEQLPNIFERFYRVDKARSRDKGGTGLGLAIAKETVESAFHGKITITSELNKGTDVTVIIPIPKKT